MTLILVITLQKKIDQDLVIMNNKTKDEKKVVNDYDIWYDEVYIEEKI